MANWTYQCYVDGKKPSLWQRWHDANPLARGAHDAAFELLEQMEEWAPPKFKSLRRELRGLDEVRFLGQDRRQWRVFGKAYQKEQRFVVLIIGFHKGNNYTPSNVLGEAMQRLKEVKTNPKKAVKCERPNRQA